MYVQHMRRSCNLWSKAQKVRGSWENAKSKMNNIKSEFEYWERETWRVDEEDWDCSNTSGSEYEQDVENDFEAPGEFQRDLNGAHYDRGFVEV